MKRKSYPNIVPLCDILLVLLIIFMVISPVMNQGMDIALPEYDGELGWYHVVLTICENGRFLVNEEEYHSLYELEKRLRYQFMIMAYYTLPVLTEKGVLYRDVIDALDVVKAAGVRTIVMPTRNIYQ